MHMRAVPSSIGRPAQRAEIQSPPLQPRRPRRVQQLSRPSARERFPPSFPASGMISSLSTRLSCSGLRVKGGNRLQVQAQGCRGGMTIPRPWVFHGKTNYSVALLAESRKSHTFNTENLSERLFPGIGDGTGLQLTGRRERHQPHEVPRIDSTIPNGKN